MKTVLIVNGQEPEEDCSSKFIYVLKISALVCLTYGLIVCMFEICLRIEYASSPISSSYINGGGILLGLFLLEVTLWGIAWCWGAKRRDSLRRTIVERQLAQIRAQEQAMEELDLAEEKRMIEEKRRMMNR